MKRGIEIKAAFDRWFAAKVGAKQVRLDDKAAILSHMKAYGFFEKQEFDKGLKHFGA